MHRLPRALVLRQQQSLHQHFIRTPFQLLQQRARLSIFRKQPPTEVPHFRTQTVRFKKPFFTRKRLATTLIYTAIIAWALRSVWQFMELEIEFLDVEELEEMEAQAAEQGQTSQGEEDEEEFYDEEDSLFIPLTWAQKIPREFYKGSDPEWQEFVKISRDEKQMQKIREELVAMVVKGSERHPQIKQKVGKDIKGGKWWLDLNFPDGPPQEYERSGIEIGDGFVAWSSQRITQDEQSRLLRTLWPTAVGGSVWETFKVMTGMQWRRAKQAFGWEGPDPVSPEELFRRAVESVAKQQQAREGNQMGNANAQANSGGGGGNTTNATLSSTHDSAQKNSHPAGRNRLPLPPNSPLANVTGPTDSSDNLSSDDLSFALFVFADHLSKNWNPKHLEPPRGTFVVQGLIEIRGQKGRMLYDVQSAYDPQEHKYVQVNVAARAFKRWKQSPIGGP